MIQPRSGQILQLSNFRVYKHIQDVFVFVFAVLNTYSFLHINGVNVNKNNKSSLIYGSRVLKGIALKYKNSDEPNRTNYSANSSILVFLH